MGTVDWTARSDQIDTFVISHITVSGILWHFSQQTC